MSKALAARVASAAHGGEMTAEQFAAQHMAQFQQHTAQLFRRLDWNGDGKLSLDEFAGPQRVRFEMMDRDGKGANPARPNPYRAPRSGRGGGSTVDSGMRIFAPRTI